MMDKTITIHDNAPMYTSTQQFDIKGKGTVYMVNHNMLTDPIDLVGTVVWINGRQHRVKGVERFAKYFYKKGDRMEKHGLLAEEVE